MISYMKGGPVALATTHDERGRPRPRRFSCYDIRMVIICGKNRGV